MPLHHHNRENVKVNLCSPLLEGLSSRSRNKEHQQGTPKSVMCSLFNQKITCESLKPHLCAYSSPNHLVGVHYFKQNIP
jgi:hypothetical protein